MPDQPDTAPDQLAPPDQPDPADAPASAELPDLAFAPVPRLRDRSNGWKPEVQRAFIAALAETGSVRAACRRVGRSEHGVYQLRAHPAGAGFRAAWDAALDLGIRRIEDAAMDRALYGVEETYHYHGELRGRRRRYNERLVMFLLRNRAPHRFASGAARGLSALDRQALERLKREWRAEWQREQDEADAEAEADTASFVDRLEQMHRTWYGHLSPRTRAAYRHFRRLEREDQDGAWLLDAEEADADYAETFADERRAKVSLLIEADGFGVDEVLAEDEQA